MVVLETALTDDLVAEGDARELARAIQDLRRQLELDLDEEIVVDLEADTALVARLAPHRATLEAETLAVEVRPCQPWSIEPGAHVAAVAISTGTVRVAVRRAGAAT